MKPTNLTIRDFFTPDAKLTFLVGAGCSVDPPSCLPAGRTMMNAIIDYTCAESEIPKIKELKGLRFEQLVEILRERLDPELKIIDYYGLCDTPNFQHFFFAEMMKRGQFVLTTNFDFLIEHTLQQLGVPKEEIRIVITKNDFETHNNPQELFSRGIKSLYKIHGSTMNILKPGAQKDTRDSLIATIQAFGSNKEGENVFQLEYFKKPLFENITKDRSLVVIGYSGSDDFDIVPTLKVLKNIHNIIWIFYSEKNNMGREQIYEIDVNTSQTLDELDKDRRKVTQILLEIWQTKNLEHVYRIDVNTADMIKNLLKSKPNLSSNEFSINLNDWLENNLAIPHNMMKYFIPYRIYYDFGIYDDAMICLEKILQLARDSKDKYWEGGALNNIGMVFYTQGNYPKALKRFEEGLQITEQVGDLNGKAMSINNIAMILLDQGNYPKALKRFEEALQLNIQLENLKGRAMNLSNIATIHYYQENYPEALKRYEEALQINEQLGDLSKKAINLNGIGLIHGTQKDYPKALKRYEEALQITEQLGDLGGEALSLNNIGNIYQDQENYPEALKLYETALQINKQIGDLKEEATSLNNIATIHYYQVNYQEALKQFEEALKILSGMGLGNSPDVITLRDNIEVIKDELS